MRMMIRPMLAATVLTAFFCSAGLSGCRQAGRVSYNISQQADNFNCIREITVIDCITGDVLFTMTGRASIETDGNELDIIVEVDKGVYKKHIIGLSDNVTYVVEDITGADVDEYRYELNFNPKMWLPVSIESID